MIFFVKEKEYAYIIVLCFTNTIHSNTYNNEYQYIIYQEGVIMKKTNVRHIFPGGNTSQGFYSYYDYILPQSQANHIFCLKGGPGVGKSTFMQYIGDEMANKGYDVDFLHCSSDNSSLDGVLFPGVNIALIDGTSPHVVDPKNPGAVDEIINLGDFWDKDNIKLNKTKIIDANKEVAILFKRAYKYLAAAKSIYDDNKEIYKKAANNAAADMEVEKLISNELFFLPVCEKRGSIKKQFASAITPDGLICHLDSVIPQDSSIYLVCGAPGSGTSKLMSRMADEAMMRGIDVEAYYCPIEPQKRIEHLYIPQLNLALISQSKYHNIKRKNTEFLDMSRYIDDEIMMQNSDALDFNTENFDMLLAKAVETINCAKITHDFMETFYIPNMNFEKQHDLRDKILERILNYIN